jgi:hypothetical protein
MLRWNYIDSGPLEPDVGNATVGIIGYESRSFLLFILLMQGHKPMVYGLFLFHPKLPRFLWQRLDPIYTDKLGGMIFES